MPSTDDDGKESPFFIHFFFEKNEYLDFSNESRIIQSTLNNQTNKNDR